MRRVTITSPLLLLAVCAAALTGAASSVAAGTVHREHELNDGRAAANGPLRSGSTWSGTLSTRNDSDWFKLYLGKRTQVTVTVTNTSAHGTHTLGIQLLGRANEIHYSTIFYPGNSRTLARTFKRGVAWVHITASPGYDVRVPTSYRFTVHASSRLLGRQP